MNGLSSQLFQSGVVKFPGGVLRHFHFLGALNFIRTHFFGVAVNAAEA